MRGGWPGALAAWSGFTLPSALALYLFAQGAGAIHGGFGLGVIDGLKALAVAVVAHAVLGMGRSLSPGGARLALALAALGTLAVWNAPLAQLAVIVAGGVLGPVLGLGDGRGQPKAGHLGRVPARRAGAVCVALAIVLLAAVPAAVAAGIGGGGLALFEAFYRAGALVFGGGHVVLPLLESSVVAPGWVAPADFVAGYGAAQAVPGPIFTFAAYLGAIAGIGPGGVAGAAIALAGIFLPGLLLVAGMLPFWDALRRVAPARAVLAGVNAAVVGVLASALYDPVFVAGIADELDFALGAAAFCALAVWRAPVWAVVLAVALAGGARGALGL
jgi:chromate transporter